MKILMCEPSHFQVKYKINPWMKIGSVDKNEAYKEWLELLEIFKRLGILVDVIEQKENLPDMVFTADQGVFKNKQVILSNFRYKQRKGENQIYRKWFEKNNFTVHNLTPDIFFEGGGEGIWFGNKLLIGVGFRGGTGTIREIGNIWENKIVPLNLVNPFFYHLDTCLFVLNPKTVFYYPDAFSVFSRNTLIKIVPNLIPVSKKEAENFALNSVVTDHCVVLQEGNKDIIKEIEGLGYKTIQTNVSEFNKAGGGIHCLTGIIEESAIN